MNKFEKCIAEINEFDKIDRLELLGSCIDTRLNDSLMEYAKFLSQAVEKAKTMIANVDAIKVIKSVNAKFKKSK